MARKTRDTRTLDLFTFDALEAVNADGHRFDVFINCDGEIIRPFLIVWQDIHSRKIISTDQEKGGR